MDFADHEGTDDPFGWVWVLRACVTIQDSLLECGSNRDTPSVNQRAKEIILLL
jgi:hypothetical protein